LAVRSTALAEIPPGSEDVALPLADGSAYLASASDSAEWSRAYPSVDLAQEFRHMRQWLLADPSRRKTPRGVRKFVVGWLGRAQDKPRPRQQFGSPSGLTRKGEEMRKALDAGSPHMFADIERLIHAKL
jgi:hypothetical protein